MPDNTIEDISSADQLRQLLAGIPIEVKGRDFLLDLLPRHSICVEIGVHLGDFSQQILHIVSPKKLHLIDPWKYQDSNLYETALYGRRVESGQPGMDERYLNVCKRFQQQISVGQMEIHRGNSSDILTRFPDDYFDWVYIDGNHLYEYVKRDLVLSTLKTKSGGLVTGDDYIEGGWWDGGVKKAVDEFTENQAVQLIGIRSRQFMFLKII